MTKKNERHLCKVELLRNVGLSLRLLTEWKLINTNLAQWFCEPYVSVNYRSKGAYILYSQEGFKSKIAYSNSQCIKRKHLEQKKFKFHAVVKKCHFGNFSEKVCAQLISALKKWSYVVASEKLFLLWDPTYEYLERLEGKIRKCLFI